MLSTILDKIHLAADRAGYDGPWPCPTSNLLWCTKTYRRSDYTHLEGKERKKLYTHVLNEDGTMYQLTCLECAEKRANELED